jgi:two-component system LytT family sensor kinase
MNNNTEKIESEYKVLTRDSIIALVVWMLLIFGLLLIDTNIDLIALFFVTVPVAIGVHGLSAYSLIPTTLANNKRFLTYWLKVVWVTTAVSIPVLFISAMALHRHEAVAIIAGFNVGFQLLVVAPFSWITYKRRLAGKAEILNLKTALGTSAAQPRFFAFADKPALFIQRPQYPIRHRPAGKRRPYRRGHTAPGRYDALYAAGEHARKDTAHPRDRLP